MKILLVGDFQFHSQGDYRRQISICQKVFDEMGHQTVPFDYRKAVSLENFFRKLPKLYKLTPFISQLRNKWINSRLVQRAAGEKPDMMFVIQGEILFPQTLRAISDHLGVKTVCWWGEIHQPATAEKLAGAYDHFFHFDSYYADTYRAMGAGDCRFLPFACDPALHRPLKVEPNDIRQYGCDVSFAGTWYPKREAFLNALAGCDLKIWGPGWHQAAKDSPLRKQYQGSGIFGDELIKLYSASKITINIQREYDGIAHSTVMRTFEATGCGIMLLAEWRQDLETLFAVGEELQTFQSPDELKRKVEYYLKNETERKAIAARGRLRAITDHTYQKRMEEILHIVQSGG